ncbi:hypothetical protein EJB05_39173 [Eragrostis curvula]|uniref:Uncharacterized protein n=1 Tax=Eragrostis curvula TaxID=38414 RepID=A0A5J9TY65_9POAL|nr:hypothetical protein EJB05_39173 [Eragrostis curvula]
MAAAQLHGSVAAAAAYRRARPFAAATPCRWLQNPLLGSPKISISTSGVGMKPIDFRARMSTKCANENAQVEEFVKADENKRSAKIHDFCLGIPFGGLLFSMGLLGYIFSKSAISLVLGVAPGLTTLVLGTLSLKFWRSGRSSVLFILAQAAISAFLAWKYSHAYFLTNRLLPWGFYASLSTAMACFYAYVLLAGGNPPPKKLAAAPPL